MCGILNATSRTQNKTAREILHIISRTEQTVREILHIISRTEHTVREILHITNRTQNKQCARYLT